RTITIKYEAGDFYVGQGYKAGARNCYNSNGYYVSPIGFGNATVCKASKLILRVEVDGLFRDVWVDRFFKDNLGRLTEKRRCAIMHTMPDSIVLEENLSRNGELYYTTSENDMNLWLNRVNRLLY
ncbi:hypothetical protein, partial [Anaerosporobacter sp.]|uniref:hypothetical protein n=1 Tax=Anaerosporobacter sp. TaxID=1872529 RepID=UPI00286F063A